MAENYVLRITAGSGYDDDLQVQVPINAAQPIHISSELADIELNVRIQNYKGIPHDAPTTTPYFDTEPHAYNQDQYSISFRFTPKDPGNGTGAGISGNDLQFGNDFDHPIRDRLPPGFNTAMSIVKWWIDPGLEGDAYADKPYLYGPALSSFNIIHIGPGEFDEEKGGLWFEEGGDETGATTRQELAVPDSSKARMKWALRAENKEKWAWEYGRTYGLDFFNPYLDFAKLALKLPGFSLPIIKYWDGQGLRYVLRNRQTGQTYLVVLITLYHKDFVNEDGSLKDGAKASLRDRRNKLDPEEEVDVDEAFVLMGAREKFGPKYGENGFDTTSPGDVD
ncbi:hypothetical protein BGZ63DRAFT_60591 [Mariannaea sp. PMI_226]|nr:hypothetical protein BGZ63DRAFT_60591 [Mariannaea sp. PMI_226]